MPHSGGGDQRSIGDSRPVLPSSIQPPISAALFLYGGLPMTTVMGWSFLMRFASLRDAAIVSTMLENCVSAA